MKKILFIILFLLCSYAVSAEEGGLPQYTGYVNDFANALSPAAESVLTALAQQIEEKTAAQIAILTVNSVKPLTIEDYAVRLFEKWGIGQKDKDNGLLILVAVNDRKVRIETGYGLEGALPDALCSRIIQQIMIPEFKRGDINKGIINGTIAVAEAIANEYNIKLDLDRKVSSPKKITPAALFFILYFIYPIIYLLIHSFSKNRRRRRNYWYGSGYYGGGWNSGSGGGSSGGFSGGFGGFSGGFSGGGGASGSW